MNRIVSLILFLFIFISCTKRYAIIKNTLKQESQTKSLENYEKRYPNGFYSKFFVGYTFYDNAVWNQEAQKEEADFGFNNTLSYFPSLGYSWSKILNKNIALGITIQLLAKDSSDIPIEVANFSYYIDEIGRGPFLEFAVGSGSPKKEDSLKYLYKEIFMRAGIGYAIASGNSVESNSFLIGANVFFFPSNFHKYEKQVQEITDNGGGSYTVTFKTVEVDVPKDSYIVNAQFYIGWGF